MGLMVAPFTNVFPTTPFPKDQKLAIQTFWPTSDSNSQLQFLAQLINQLLLVWTEKIVKDTDAVTMVNVLVQSLKIQTVQNQKKLPIQFAVANTLMLSPPKNNTNGLIQNLEKLKF